MPKVYIVSKYNYLSWSEHIQFTSTNKDKAFEYFEKHSNYDFSCGWSIQECQGEKYEILKSKFK